MLNLAQALDELTRLTASGLATPQQLMAMADKVSLDTALGYQQGSVTLLYSGKINGVESSTYVGQMIDHDERGQARNSFAPQSFSLTHPTA